MNIKALEYFIRLAEYQNFSKAARQLYISQTALSKIIAGLEEEVGERLFIRNKNTVSLSAAGLAYLNFAKKTVELYQKSRKTVKDALLEKGILSKCEYGVKILGNGEVTKKLTVRASAFSASAKEKIEKAGGTVEVI